MKNKLLEILIKYSLIVVAGAICVYIPIILINYFLIAGPLAVFCLFTGGYVYGIFTEKIRSKGFKKKVAKEFEKALMEQQQYYRDKIVGLGDDIIKRLKEHDKED